METSTEFESAILEIIKDRRSRRSYADTPIEPEKIKSLFEAARWAPSAGNEQPWTYIYATKDQPELWNKLLDTLNEGNRIWAARAPLLILSIVRKLLTNGRENTSAKYDLGGANAFLTLQAVELGLHSHQMGGFDHKKAIANLNIPDSYELGVMMAIGYNGDPDTLAENLKAREAGPRQRYTRDVFVMNKTF